MIASDGYEYESLAHRLLGEPKDNSRNREVRALRANEYPENEVTAWITAYDRVRGNHHDKSPAGWRALDRQRSKSGT